MQNFRQVSQTLPYGIRTNLVILDGPRCSGKTTLGTRLEARLRGLGIKGQYFKKGPPAYDERTNMLEHLSVFWNLIERGDADVLVVDRFVMSELVMGIALHRTPVETLLPYCREITTRLNMDWRVQHVCLLPPMAVIETRMDERPEGRRWDMDPTRVKSLWDLALSLTVGAQVYTSVFQDGFVDDLCRDLLIPRANAVVTA